MKQSALYIIIAGLCIGVAGEIVLQSLFFLAGALSLAAVFLAVSLRATHARYVVGALLFASIAVGIARADLWLWRESTETLSSWYGEPSVMEGIVSDDPDRRENTLRLILRVQMINREEGSGVLLAIVPRDSEISYGDIVSVRGIIEEPQNFETNGGREFDYENYLRTRGVSALMPHATLRSTEEGEWSLQRSLFSLKHSFERSVESVFAEPHGSLLEGILLGEKRGLSQDLTDAFIASGLIHVVVLSGYNISIVSEAALRVLSFLPASLQFSIGGIGMILFAMLSGAGAATIRALIMGLIAVVARYLHRPNLALRALALAGGAMVMWNPLSLLYDSGFILSFLATFGLITLAPYVEVKLLKFHILRNKRFAGIRSIAASTIAVQIFILPALLYFSGVLSLLALPANILALPLIPSVMFLGFTAGMLGFIHGALALIAAIPAQILLQWVLIVAQATASIPFGAVVIPAFPAWVAILAYIPLCIWATRTYTKFNKHSGGTI